MKIAWLLLIGVLASFYPQVDEWHVHWAKAVKHCHNAEYDLAETQFNFAISTLEETQDYSHPHVYIDRARLYALQSRYEEALIDLNQGIASDDLNSNDRLRGLVTRIFTCSHLDMNDQVLADLDTFKKISTNFS